jgi:hypothetical protein
LEGLHAHITSSPMIQASLFCTFPFLVTERD